MIVTCVLIFGLPAIGARAMALQAERKWRGEEAEEEVREFRVFNLWER